ncbi:casbene synthase [Vigna unguiculata]|uniref:Casbene synthase n=1 Tax=Vigna unguiculata TaxID=3917 RepID=A0A4D6LYF5_VIGUN|nr:casbene synthase [Vigna unguiculata]
MDRMRVPYYSHPRDKVGKFKESIVNDVQGMLSLYEAFQLRFHGEEILEETYKKEVSNVTKALLDIFEETKQELKQQGKEYFVKYSKNEIKRLAQAYLSESRWFHSNHTPRVEEYVKVATVTNTYALLTSVSFLGMEDTTEEVLIWPTSHPKIIEAASVICRLMDDIVGTEVSNMFHDNI